MPTLAETYASLHAVLRGQHDVATGAAELGVNPERLAIYAGFVRGHITGILAKQYPRVSQTMAAEPWERLCEGFYAAHPATHWELNAAAEPFASYLLAQLGDVEGLTLFHVSLAQFEWAQWATFSDLAQIPDPHSHSTDTVNPTLRILELPCPVIETVLALSKEGALKGELPSAEAGPEQVLMFRHPVRETSAFWRVTEPLVLALATVDAGLDATQSAAQLGRSVEEVMVGLQRAKEIGLIIGPHTE